MFATLKPPSSLCLILGVLIFSGCSSIPNRETVSPTSFPSRKTPGPRENMEKINIVRLRMDKPEVERLGPGDVLGIYIATVTGGEKGEPPMHNMERNAGEAPAQGYPYPVRSDGTISLPMLKKPLYIEGMSLIEAEDTIRSAYIQKEKLLAEQANISVAMIRKRTYHVSVIREDVNLTSEGARASGGGGGSRGQGESYFGSVARGSASSLELPAYRNDILEALDRTGGLPGLNAKNELIILRKTANDRSSSEKDYLPKDPAAFASSVANHYNKTGEISGLGSDLGIIRIPIRVAPNEIPPKLTSEDVSLYDGDVIYIQSREAEVYYTGGMIKGGVFPIPRDYDLDVLGAIATAGGGIGVSVGGGDSSMGGGRSNFLLPPTRIIVLRDIDGRQMAIRVPKSDALRNPAYRVLIEPNDVILLEYTNMELVFNMVFSCINLNINPVQFFRSTN